MNRNEVLKKYNKNYLEQEFYNNNIYYAFSENQLQEGMRKLGAKDTDELTSIFGAGDICLKSKVKELVTWINSQSQERVKWLVSLTEEEKEIIIEYEIGNHECTYTWDIEPVVDLLQDIFGYNLIVKVWQKVKKEYQESFAIQNAV